ncbi:hypothetical protein BCV70DRAFT_198212 [Testicularia cyperi]|uniref:GID complex catalytic subunit 2 n=1 Tax=Testicularia cyperi TaxID=1882483 RepID=A0A317XVJ2_9BASI|nr:hypothetical protein BCV70DRAFT_198212 [Testicularia cyperi]
MEAIQKSLDQVAKKVPGLHSVSASTKTAATNPSVHDSIDRLIAQLEAAKAAVASTSSSPDPGVVVAELRHAVETAQKNVLDRHKEFHSVLSKSTKALDKKFPVPIDGVADPRLFSSAESEAALNRIVLQHLQRNGDWSTSKLFAEATHLPVSTDAEDLFGHLHTITAAMIAGDLRPAISWAQSNRSFLAARKSPLEFALHRSQFLRIAAGTILPGMQESSNEDPDGENVDVDMMSVSVDQLPDRGHARHSHTAAAHPMDPMAAALASTNTAKALEYGRTHFRDFLGTHLKEIQRLLTLLTFLPQFIPALSYGTEDCQYDSVPVEHLLPSVPPVYRPLLDANLVHAPFLEPFFRLEFCAKNRLAKEAPLSIAVEVGAGGALNRIIKVKAVMKQRGNEWSQADELPIEIPLPHRLRFHSIFACPVSKEQGTERNPPMMLLCGHVLCLETLNRLAKGNGRFKCPYCPTESYVNQAIRVHF